MDKTPPPANRSQKKRLPVGIIRKNKARLAAVQAVYSQDITGDDVDIDTLIQSFLQNFMEEQAEGDTLVPDIKFFKKLMRGIYGHFDEVDGLVSGHLGSGWDMERLGGVMRSLLRVGVAELVVFPKTPLKTVVNEYVSLAKGFFTEQEVGFVNGILDRIGHKVRATETGGS